MSTQCKGTSNRHVAATLGVALCFTVFWSATICAIPGAHAFLSLTQPRKRTFAIHSSVNPNDLETPEERRQRMELVRQLQKSFYKDEEGITLHTKNGTIANLPLWRVQWTELPGNQNVLNCHVPHYTHMFQKLLASSSLPYFGHLYLPGGSENLNNPQYRLDDNVNTKATRIGVLMRVADYKQMDDGRLLLIVQGMERFRVLEASQHEPYGIATVQFQPDAELLESSNANMEATLEQAKHWQDFEFRTVLLEDANNGVSPLVNYNADALSELETTPTTEQETGALQDMEHDVWVALDTMIRLLDAVNPNPVQVPIPTQLLGLLPTNTKWPDGFCLDKMASKLSNDPNAMVGTMSKSPYCWVDKVAPANYPSIRRVSRFSFAIWILLESIVFEPQETNARQEILELDSIKSRLESAKSRLDRINYTLGQALKGK